MLCCKPAKPSDETTGKRKGARGAKKGSSKGGKSSRRGETVNDESDDAPSEEEDESIASKKSSKKKGTGKGKGKAKGSSSKQSIKKSKKKKDDSSKRSARDKKQRGMGASDVALSDLDQDARLMRSRCYAHVNERYEPSRFDYKHYKLEWSSPKRYEIYKKTLIGEGAYGEVFLAEDKEESKTVCIKTIREDKADLTRVQKEVMMLHLLKDGPDVVKLLGQIKSEDSMGLVFEYVRNPDYRNVYKKMQDNDARAYIYRLLRTLNYVHSQGIIHRDVKGGNVLYDPNAKLLRVIDWGFAEFYHPKVRHVDWPGTRTYKSPDLFLHYDHYCYSVDLWAVGCMMGSLLFQRFPLFRSKNCYDKALANKRQMASVVRYLGTDDYDRYLKKYKFSQRLERFFRTDAFENADKLHRSRVDWHKFVNNKNKHVAVPSGVDLIDRLLVFDHERRLTAREAMAHPYFDPVRDEIEATSEEEDSQYVANVSEEIARLQESNNDSSS